MRNKKVQICKEGKLDQPVLGAGVMDTLAGTALDAFVHHGLAWTAKKAVEIGRYYGSEALRNKKLQKKAIDYALDKLNPVIHNVGSQAIDQLSTKIRPKKIYNTNRKDLDGGALDIHKAIGKLPRPAGGWTLPGHKYTGPYNDLENQVRYNPKTGEILEIYDQSTGPTDAVATQHDIDYRVIWCSDLVEMQRFSKWNKGYRYLLMVLDLFSKYGWIVPLKDKKGETVTEAFKTIFKEGRKPQYLWTDKEKEYYNKNMKELLEKNNITLYSTENEEKSSVCERWNRTIKTKMWKQFTVQGNTEYLDILPKILEQYNNTKHSSIKMTPVEASKKKNGGAVYYNLYGDMKQLSSKPKFKIGDKVRISKYKRKVFDKGYTPNWTEEIFLIDKIQSTNPITYRLKDLNNEEIQGSFYEPELLPAKQDVFRIEKVIRRDYKKKQALVKWLGYSDDFNSWIPLSNLQELSN